MGKELFPNFIKEHYEIHEWKHATAILKNDFVDEWDDIIQVLKNFRFRKSWITVGVGEKSEISKSIDKSFAELGWKEKMFSTKVTVDENSLDSPTHKVDCYKNRIALEIEWNNKDPFFDRDLNNFRLLFDLRAISIGIIITRCTELQKIFNSIGKSSSYGASTTHIAKLLTRIEGGGGGGCPILVFGITNKLYIED